MIQALYNNIFLTIPKYSKISYKLENTWCYNENYLMKFDID